jgi:hypothetical protein
MKNELSIPLKIYISLTETIDEHIVEWMDSNRDTVLRCTMLACRELIEEPDLEEVVVAEIHEDSPILDEMNSLIAIISIHDEDILGNLEECEEYFASIEEYETAEEVLELRNIYNQK